MRFTKVQAALFQCGVSFVHMAPTEARAYHAYKDFRDAIRGIYTSVMNERIVRSGDGKTFARFMICVPQGASTDHCPVMFMDGKKDEFNNKFAYDQSRYIPAEDADGCGPMVVR